MQTMQIYSCVDGYLVTLGKLEGCTASPIMV